MAKEPRTRDPTPREPDLSEPLEGKQGPVKDSPGDYGSKPEAAATVTRQFLTDAKRET